MNKKDDWIKFLEENPHFGKLMQKMCNYTDKKPNVFDLQPWTRNWFLKYSWTGKQKEAFKKWAINYLYTDNNARREIMRVNLKNKKLIEDTIEWFVFDYGWKIE